MMRHYKFAAFYLHRTLGHLGHPVTQVDLVTQQTTHQKKKLQESMMVFKAIYKAL